MSQTQSPIIHTNNDIIDSMDSDGMAPRGGYALSGRIMLAAIVMLFAVVVLMICLHIYARWYLQRARRLHQHRHRNSNRTHLVFYSEPNSAASRGLDAAVLGSLPVFLYSPETLPHVLECAVCLSEFEEKDKLRVLPNCNHGFHLDCIDMWFHSHSTCPLCRSPVEPVNDARDCVISICEPGDARTAVSPGSSSGLCDTCQEKEHGSSSRNRVNQEQLGDRRKGFELERVRIEVPPRRNDSVDELRLSSPASQGLRSPMATRLMSLKRILSLNTKGGGFSPSSSGVGTSCGVELDVECGKGESTQVQSRVQTPR